MIPCIANEKYRVALYQASLVDCYILQLFPFKKVIVLIIASLGQTYLVTLGIDKPESAVGHLFYMILGLERVFKV